jgi:Tfp pilus assembly protein PilE
MKTTQTVTTLVCAGLLLVIAYQNWARPEPMTAPPADESRLAERFAALEKQYASQTQELTRLAREQSEAISLLTAQAEKTASLLDGVNATRKEVDAVAQALKTKEPNQDYQTLVTELKQMNEQFAKVIKFAIGR